MASSLPDALLAFASAAPALPACRRARAAKHLQMLCTAAATHSANGGQAAFPDSATLVAVVGALTCAAHTMSGSNTIGQSITAAQQTHSAVCAIGGPKPPEHAPSGPQVPLQPALHGACINSCTGALVATLLQAAAEARVAVSDAEAAARPAALRVPAPHDTAPLVMCLQVCDIHDMHRIGTLWCMAYTTKFPIPEINVFVVFKPQRSILSF